MSSAQSFGLSFVDRVAIVTGAGRGLGRAYAMELARRGAKVLVNDAGVSMEGEPEAVSPADAVVAEIESAGGAALADRGDITSARDIEALVGRTISKWGRIDALVNNAGNVRRRSFAETGAADVLSHIETHVIGSLQLSQAVWPYMTHARYGRIILTTSQVGMYGQTNLTAYGAAKGGVIGLLQGMKLAAKDTGIQVNCIAPFGLTRASPPGAPAALTDWLSAERVAPAVVYLAHHSCVSQGEVFVAAAGHFAVARTIESKGVVFDNLEEITAESFAARIAEVTELGAPPAPNTAIEAVQPYIDRLDARFS